MDNYIRIVSYKQYNYSCYFRICFNNCVTIDNILVRYYIKPNTVKIDLPKFSVYDMAENYMQDDIIFLDEESMEICKTRLKFYILNSEFLMNFYSGEIFNTTHQDCKQC